jgi:hypothetical protein
MKRIFAITFAACAALGLARAASAQEYYGPQSLPPQPAPPPAVEEDYGPPPAAVAPERDYWVRGHWDWNGVQYAWVGGHYVQRQVGLFWEPGRWVARDGQWVWIGGHWRR